MEDATEYNASVCAKNIETLSDVKLTQLANSNLLLSCAHQQYSLG